MVEFATNNAWLFIGRIAAVGSGAVLTIAFANLLTPTAFGTYKYVLAMAALIGTIALTGMGGSAMRAVAQGHKNIIPRLFWICFITSIPGALIAGGIAAYYFYMGNMVLGSGLAFAALSHLLNGFILQKSLLLGSNEYRTAALYGIPRSLIPIAILIGTLLITDNLIIVLAAYFFGSLLFAYIMYRFALRQTHVDASKGYGAENDAALKETTRYSFHLSIMGSTSVAAAQLDQLLLWHFVGPAELALYALAYAPIREIRVLLENFSPMIFTRFATRTKEDLRKTIPFRTRQMLLVSALITVVYIIGAPFLFKTLFPQYMPAIIMSQILAITLLLNPKSIMENALSAQARTKIRYVTTGTMIATRGILSIILIPLYGLNGAVAALVLAEVGHALVLGVAYRFAYAHEKSTDAV